MILIWETEKKNPLSESSCLSDRLYQLWNAPTSLVIRVVPNWLRSRWNTVQHREVALTRAWLQSELGLGQQFPVPKNCQCESTTDDAVMMGFVSPSGKLLCFSLSHRFWTSLVHLEQQNPLSPAPLKKHKCKSQGKGEVPMQGSYIVQNKMRDLGKRFVQVGFHRIWILRPFKKKKKKIWVFFSSWKREAAQS